MISRYRWAFTGDPGMEDLGRKKAKEQNPNFTPHVLRISHLMNKKVDVMTHVQ